MDQQRADAGFVRRSLCLYAVTDPDLNKKQGRFVAAYARVSVQACVPSFIRCVICICQCFKSQASALCILGHMCCVSVRTYPHLSVSMCGLLCLCLYNALITYSCVCILCVGYCVMCCISVRTYPHVSVSMCGLLCLCCGMPLLRTHVFVSFVWTTVLCVAYLCVPILMC